MTTFINELWESQEDGQETFVARFFNNPSGAETMANNHENMLLSSTLKACKHGLRPRCCKACAYDGGIEDFENCKPENGEWYSGELFKEWKKGYDEAWLRKEAYNQGNHNGYYGWEVAKMASNDPYKEYYMQGYHDGVKKRQSENS